MAFRHGEEGGLDGRSRAQVRSINPEALESYDNGCRLALAMEQAVMGATESALSSEYVDIRDDLKGIRSAVISMAAKVPLTDQQVHRRLNDFINNLDDFRAFLAERYSS